MIVFFIASNSVFLKLKNFIVVNEMKFRLCLKRLHFKFNL